MVTCYAVTLTRIHDGAVPREQVQGGVLLGPGGEQDKAHGRDEQFGTGQEGVHSENHVQLIGGEGEQDEEWRPQRHLPGSDQATWGPLWGNVLQLHEGEDHCQDWVLLGGVGGREGPGARGEERGRFARQPCLRWGVDGRKLGRGAAVALAAALAALLRALSSR